LHSTHSCGKFCHLVEQTFTYSFKKETYVLTLTVVKLGKALLMSSACTAAVGAGTAISTLMPTAPPVLLMMQWFRTADLQAPSAASSAVFLLVPIECCSIAVAIVTVITVVVVMVVVLVLVPIECRSEFQ
jgi:hypothetical protein